jgi:Tfp pilus assembly protein PilE
MSLAADDDVDAAKQTKLAAIRSRKQDLERRLGAVRASFARLFQQAHKRQLAELMALQEEFRKRIEGIARAGEERVSAEQKKTAVFVQTQLRRAISEAADRVMRQAQRPRVATELAECVTTFLGERNREFLLQ